MAFMLRSRLLPMTVRRVGSSVWAQSSRSSVAAYEREGARCFSSAMTWKQEQRQQARFGVASYSTMDDLVDEIATPPPKEGESDIPAHVSDIVEKISALNMMEMMLLSKAMGEKFGVDVDAMMSGGFGGGGGGGGQAAPQEAAPVEEEAAEPEASTVNVKITALEGGVKGKFAIVKILRQLQPDLSLQDCKKMLDALPATIKEGVTPEEAAEVSEQLKAAGAEVEVK